MGTQRWTCLLGVCLCLAAGGGSAIAGVDPDAGSEAVVDPEARDGAAAAYPCDAAKPLDPDCDLIGDYINLFTGTSRYRGNVYRFDHRAVLKEIQMQLAFSGTTDLTVAIHCQQSDGTYKRFAPDVVIPGADGCGAGVPHFYSTADAVPPMDPVTIEAGSVCAIAFAWGSKSISYGRDNQSYPLPFEVGEILGLVTAGPLAAPPDPLVPETFPEFQIFTSGALSMQLCFEPQIGACCRASDQRCHEVLESQCTGAGSFFHGEYTLCAETVCNFGACCRTCGNCDNSYTLEACIAEGGVAHWSDVSCPGTQTLLCPKITGACCRAGGLCDDLMCRRDCENPPFPEPSGVYHGDGSTCSPDPCKGACCVDAFGCNDMTPDDCTGPDRTFRGTLTSCETLLPGQECPGACCYGPSSGGFTTCSEAGTRTACRYNLFPKTAYLGEGTVCPTNPQNVPAFCGQIGDYHACCLLGTNTCVNTTFDACPLHVGDYNGSFLCQGLTNGCPAAQRACCLPNGTCSVLTNGACATQGGTWQRSDTTCGAGTCVFGACCGSLPSACTLTTRAVCEGDGRVYRGDNTNCSAPDVTCPGFGSCCRADGVCFPDKTLTHCDDILWGDYHGDGSTCSPQPVDCHDSGACCAITGNCSLITGVQCAELGGVFQGAGTLCVADSCPGACCLSTGCAVRTVSNCASSAGVFQGVDVACEANLCVVGACCNGNTCSSQTQFTCERDGGTYLGDGVGCISGIPLNCAIDARQPHDPPDAGVRSVWNAITFMLACDLNAVRTGDFTVTVVPEVPDPPTIDQVTVNDHTATVTLNRPIDAGHWTCLTYIAANVMTCLGFLPGDVNGDPTSNAADVESLTSKLAGPAIPPPWECDLDRSGSCTPADILTAVDLLNGADAYDPWLNKSLTDPCPSAP